MCWRFKVPSFQCWWDPMLSRVMWDPGFPSLFHAFWLTTQIFPGLVPWARMLLGPGTPGFFIHTWEWGGQLCTLSWEFPLEPVANLSLYPTGQSCAISVLEPITGNRNNFNRRREKKWFESDLLRQLGVTVAIRDVIELIFKIMFWNILLSGIY